MSSTTIEMLVERIANLEQQMSQLIAAQPAQSAQPDEKAKKAKKVKKEKPEPEESTQPKKKRGVSGYLVFAKENRPDAKQALIDEGNETPKPTEILTQVAKMWRQLDDTDKEEWNEKAKAINSADEDDEQVQCSGGYM